MSKNKTSNCDMTIKSHKLTQYPTACKKAAGGKMLVLNRKKEIGPKERNNLFRHTDVESS